MNESQPDRHRSPDVMLGVLWGVNFASLGLLAFVLLVLVPRLALAFADFEVKLPSITVTMLQVSRSPGLVLIALGLFAAAEVAVVRLVGGGRRFVLIAGAALQIAIIIAIACAVFLPYVELLNSLSGSNASGA